MNVVESSLKLESAKEAPELLEIYHIFERAKHGARRVRYDNKIKFIGFFERIEQADICENLLSEMGCEVSRDGNKLTLEQVFSADEIEEANLDYQVE